MTESTIDAVEHAKFTRLAGLWWDPSGPFWPLHGLNNLRVAYITDSLRQHYHLDVTSPTPLAGLRCLDVGCGGGILSEALASMGAEVHGIDMIERNVQIATGHAEKSGLAIRYEHGTVETLVARSETYDAVFNMEVVEHVADVPLFIGACSQLVKPGGVMFLATLNRTFMAWLTAIVGAEYVLRWLPRGTHDWRKFRRPEELEALLGQNGMRVISRTGVRVNPINRRFALTGSLTVNYMLVAVR